ncbi:MAG: bifunctional riboflavin kinase/FAD synthetase [Deltaproteobacteria bacterium]|nr:bifunctional riboflavin kinase/FAD synthetase [Deltaproteobacteria bacterium]
MRGSAALSTPPDRAVLTIGNFDGLHRGHRAITEIIRVRAAALEGTAVVYTFDPHPRKVVQPESAPGMLLTLAQKLELLEAAGMDLVVLEPFDAEFARTPPEHFVRECIHGCIRPLEVYVGYDFHFGKEREGSMRLLVEMGPHLGFSVTVIPEITMGERDVNSTRIRELLSQGEVSEAMLLLGRPYAVRGEVVRGDQRGRTIGFPTLNLRPESEILPAHGVYAGWVRFLDSVEPEAGSRHLAVINVGRRPTFKVDDPALAEAHLLDFEGDAYGRPIEVGFGHRLRDEQRFDGPAEPRRKRRLQGPNHGANSSPAAEPRRRLVASPEAPSPRAPRPAWRRFSLPLPPQRARGPGPSSFRAARAPVAQCLPAPERALGPRGGQVLARRLR